MAWCTVKIHKILWFKSIKNSVSQTFLIQQLGNKLSMSTECHLYHLVIAPQISQILNAINISSFTVHTCNTYDILMVK